MKETAKLDLGIVIGILMVIVATLTMWQNPSENLTMTFNRPKGGEERTVQTVEMYCFTGASKGATEGNLWCQERVVEEWIE